MTERAWSEDIERILETEGLFVSTTSGTSMWPMLRDRRDTIIIRPIADVRPDGVLHKYDVPLYRRETDGAYVLHRVIGVSGARSETRYVIRGDNTYTPEYVRPDQVIGVLSDCYRGNRRIDLGGRPYRLYVRCWVAIYPIRHCCRLLRGALARTPLKGLYRACTGR
ncbi:hypothetical protein [Bifidobacterium simiarum]|uniref:Peptidase S24/S26A/S26B/S26C domain-containing protein n=1 Tax=Bifidobacterium simiarum TaxID=2045441 RepID=A0A2M9HFX7_9BIFI|nr:hypothetical protein [Bifidobacterium simiarum]PJM75728.1 hypothetical protein CSQ87_02220 [Bifidobacterium simiarum]